MEVICCNIELLAIYIQKCLETLKQYVAEQNYPDEQIK
jgi:hypothetical protein